MLFGLQDPFDPFAKFLTTIGFAEKPTPASPVQEITQGFFLSLAQHLMPAS